jgi:DNA-binding HxlR family transcriptional regulator
VASKQELEEYLNLIKKSEGNERCPVKCTLEIIGGKWKLCILSQLLKKEISRFNELKRDISGITNTMLSNSLHELENDKLVRRIQYNEMPVRVEYTLTDLGKSLLPLLYEIDTWWNNYSSNNVPKS